MPSRLRRAARDGINHVMLCAIKARMRVYWTKMAPSTEHSFWLPVTTVVALLASVGMATVAFINHEQPAPRFAYFGFTFSSFSQSRSQIISTLRTPVSVYKCYDFLLWFVTRATHREERYWGEQFTRLCL